MTLRFPPRKAGSFSWAKLQLLLGDLPTELPPEAFQTTLASIYRVEGVRVGVRFREKVPKGNGFVVVTPSP